MNKKPIFAIKVWTFWEAHKIWKNLLDLNLTLLSNVKFKWKIFSNFVCFSESPNFMSRIKS